MYEEYFPISPSLSDADKHCFLSLLSRIGQTQEFSYLEVGSHMGGSLSFPLIYKQVSRVVSIDTRPVSSPDERGTPCHYNVSTADMIRNLRLRGVPTDKLETFDGCISDYVSQSKFQVIFLDGEHTDESTFRDAVWSLRFVDSSGLIVFHDASLIHKAISNFITMISFLNLKFQVFLDDHSEIVSIAFGDFVELFHKVFENSSRPLSHFCRVM